MPFGGFSGGMLQTIAGHGAQIAGGAFVQRFLADSAIAVIAADLVFIHAVGRFGEQALEFMPEHPEGRLPDVFVLNLSIRFPAQNICNPFARVSIAIWICRMRHFCIGFFIIQQLSEVLVDHFLICSHQFQRSCCYTFWSFGCIAHNQNRFAVKRTFLLDSARVR